jgi:hypothetical protein
MKRAKENNLFQFLKDFDLTSQAADFVKEHINFNINFQMPQRNLVGLGKVIGRVISLNQVLDITNNGFRKDLAEGGIAMLQQEISGLLAVFSFKNNEQLIDDYEENSSWLNFITA